MSLEKDINELLEAGVFDVYTAEKVREHYNARKSSPAKKLVLVFGILGAILVGLGLILIVAHNWDDITKRGKTLFAFLPLFIGQSVCIYTLFQRSDSKTWLESSATFLFLAIGASISLVSQIYHISGNFANFLLTWSLLGLPLVYLMRSSTVSLFYIIGITWYALDSNGWFGWMSRTDYWYWPLMAAVLPHYYQLWISKPRGQFTSFHHWLFVGSLTWCVGIFAHDLRELVLQLFFGLFAAFYLAGTSRYFSDLPASRNAYRVVGSLGTVYLLLVITFKSYWTGLGPYYLSFSGMVSSPAFYVLALFLVGLSYILYKRLRSQKPGQFQPLTCVFLVFLALYFLKPLPILATLLSNLVLLLIAVYTIWDGIRKEHLGFLNYGLLMLAALVICRFFDSDMSYVSRGMVFMLLGSAFFMGNYKLLQKRKSNES